MKSYRYTELQVCRVTGMKSYRYEELQVYSYRGIGIQGYRNKRRKGYRDTGLPLKGIQENRITIKQGYRIY